MAIKASATITITVYRDTDSITRYYKLQSSSLAFPSKPTTNPPSGWDDTEPAYVNGSTNTLYFCDLMVFSNGEWQYSDVSKSSSYEAAKQAYNKAVAAEKVATNFMAYDSTNGLLVGNKTSGSWSGCRSQILPTSFNILNQDGQVLSSFGADKVILGQNAANSEIDLCDGAGKIKAITSGATTSYPHYDSIEVTTQDFMTESHTFAATTKDGSNYQNDSEFYMLSQTSSAGAYARMKGECTNNSSGDICKTGVSSMALGTSSSTRTLIFSEFWDESAGTWAQSNQINVYPTKTTLSKPVVLDGITITGKNKILWSGAYYMSETQTATLSETVSSQANGIVLLWSYYTDGAADNSAFNSFFVPKQFVTNFNGKGITMFMATATMGVAANKYVYVSNTNIKGYAKNNDGATDTACGIKSTPNKFVLRYVIGI